MVEIIHRKEISVVKVIHMVDQNTVTINNQVKMVNMVDHEKVAKKIHINQNNKIIIKNHQYLTTKNGKHIFHKTEIMIKMIKNIVLSII